MRSRRTSSGLSGRIPLTYVNRGDQAVYFDTCGIWLEGSRAGNWIMLFQGICAGGIPPVRISPGETYQRDLRFSHPFDENSFPRFLGPAISGKYRVVMQFYADVEGNAGVETPTDPLPPEAGRSNEFRLDLP